MKNESKKGEKEIIKEIEQLETIEYGLKEFIHGILIGMVLGFIVAWIVFQ